MARIADKTLMHGAALIQILPKGKGVSIERLDNGYVVAGRLGVWIKTTKRALPAQFTFGYDEIQEMLRMRRQVDNLVVGLVCLTQGVCCLSWDQLTSLLALGDSSAKTISVRRAHGGAFRVKGTDRKRPIIVKLNAWGPRVLNI